jgi:short-subunit dehydrogenase
MLAEHPVKVTAVHPGGIKTAIARNAIMADGIDADEVAANFDKQFARTSPQRAAQLILNAVHKDKARVLVGPDAKLLDLVVRVTGSGYQRMFTSFLKLSARKPAALHGTAGTG